MTNSLEQFMYIVDTQYSEIKKHILSKNEHHIVIEDPKGDCVFGSNEDLEPIFKNPNLFHIKNFSITHKEKDSCFIITIDLK